MKVFEVTVEQNMDSEVIKHFAAQKDASAYIREQKKAPRSRAIGLATFTIKVNTPQRIQEAILRLLNGEPGYAEGMVEICRWERREVNKKGTAFKWERIAA